MTLRFITGAAGWSHRRSAHVLAFALAVLMGVSPVLAQTVTPLSVGPLCAPFTVSIKLPPAAVNDKVDVFFLFDDTLSFESVAPSVISVFGSLVSELETTLPGVSFGFGVGRYEDYGGLGSGFSDEFGEGRPFILNQPIVTAATAASAGTTSDALIGAALANTAPGLGGDFPESAFEGLNQLATGQGFDANGDSDFSDLGDVPPFSSNALPTSGNLGGVGWRPGALHLVIVAADICPVAAFPFVPAGIPTLVTGVGGVAVPVGALACPPATSAGTNRFGYVSDALSVDLNTVVDAGGNRTSVAPLGAATVQSTVDALNALGIRVLGIGQDVIPTDDTNPSFDPSNWLSAIAKLTGAVDSTGSPLVFDAGVAFTGVSDAILAAITATTTAPISISLTTSPLPAGLAISPTPLVQTGVLPNASAPFDVTVLSGGVAIADGTGVQATFDLNFVETGSQQVLGTIPITVGCTAPDLTPLAVADTNAATEGGAAVTGNVITTAPGTDNEGDGPATVTGASQGASSITLATPFTTAAGGSLTLNANGSYSYTPPAQGNVPTAGLTETFSYTITDADGDPSTTTLSIAVTDVPLPPPPPTGPGTFTLRINAGGRAFTDSAGQVWAADQFFSGGGIFTNERAIAGTDDDALYQTERTGTRNGRGDAFAYNIPVPNGTYAVTLGFADIYWASAGQRVFDVSIEGQEVISDLDIIATVGPKTVLNLTFQAVVADGVLNIDFVSLVDNAKVSTIQVVAVDSSNAAPPNPPPADPGDFALRINAGGPAFTDSAGQVWAADQHFSGGGIFVNERAIAGTNDDPLYQTERTGTRNGPGDAFAYNIPVPNGTYAVTLSFADIYWTSTGRRRFGVSIEGQAVLSDLDIVATVGPKTALNLAFQAVVTDGTLNIDFVSLVDNAKVSAIQVIAVGTSTVALTNATPVGLAAAWEFNEGAGPTVGDASGNGQTGTIANATWTAGHTGAAALAFNGSNASVSTSSSVVKAASSFTLSAWFKTNTTTGAHHILWEGAAGNNGFGEPVNSPASSEMGLTVGSYNQNNKIAFFLGYDVPGNGKGANPIYIVSTSNFTDTTSWHHVAVTVTDLGNGSFSGSLYVDGVLQGTDTGVQNDRSKWGSMVIGKSGAASRYFNGNIDAVRIYSRALSADEIVTDMTTP